MAPSHFDAFLTEATYPDPSTEARFDPDRLYGLYTSWCFINQQPLSPEDLFWEAIGDRAAPGNLRMKGPAAADYIIASYPKLL